MTFICRESKCLLRTKEKINALLHRARIYFFRLIFASNLSADHSKDTYTNWQTCTHTYIYISKERGRDIKWTHTWIEYLRRKFLLFQLNWVSLLHCEGIYFDGVCVCSILNGETSSHNSLFSINNWMNSFEVIRISSRSLPWFNCSSECFNSSRTRDVFSGSSFAWSRVAIFEKKTTSLPWTKIRSFLL